MEQRQPSQGSGEFWLAGELARRDAETADALRAELGRRQAEAQAREAEAGPPPPGVARQGRGWLAAQLARADVDRAEEQARASAVIARNGRRLRRV